mmetsp:Transcript_40495/g.92973  ORF Transcript_40495/g.92973 Transcript_40495/m.92973 type:complete len:263 (+) Transcript_40495:772-1560(+)
MQHLHQVDVILLHPVRRDEEEAQVDEVIAKPPLVIERHPRDGRALLGEVRRDAARDLGGNHPEAGFGAHLDVAVARRVNQSHVQPSRRAMVQRHVLDLPRAHGEGLPRIAPVEARAHLRRQLSLQLRLVLRQNEHLHREALRLDELDRLVPLLTQRRQRVDERRDLGAKDAHHALQAPLLRAQLLQLAHRRAELFAEGFFLFVQFHRAFVLAVTRLLRLPRDLVSQKTHLRPLRHELPLHLLHSRRVEVMEDITLEGGFPES